MLPKIIYLRKYEYKKKEENVGVNLDFTIYEFSLNKDGKFTNIKIVQENNDNADGNVKKEYKEYKKYTEYLNRIDINCMNIINVCCILDKDNEYKSDITTDIRPFIHHIDNLNCDVLWDHILLYLNIKDEHALYISINDDDLTEKILYINELKGKIFHI